MKKRAFLTLCLLLSLVFNIVACGDSSSNGVSKLSDIPAERIENQHTVSRNGHTYTYVKYRDENGKVQGVVFDDKGKLVNPSTINEPPSNPIGTELQTVLDNSPKDDTSSIELIVDLNDDVQLPELPMLSGAGNKEGRSVLLIDGKPATQAEIDELNKKHAGAIKKYEEARKAKRKERLDQLIRDNELNIPKDIQDSYVNGDDALVVTLKIKDVKSFIEKNKSIIRFVTFKPETMTTSSEDEMSTDDKK